MLQILIWLLSHWNHNSSSYETEPYSLELEFDFVFYSLYWIGLLQVMLFKSSVLGYWKETSIRCNRRDVKLENVLEEELFPELHESAKTKTGQYLRYCLLGVRICVVLVSVCHNFPLNLWCFSHYPTACMSICVYLCLSVSLPPSCSAGDQRPQPEPGYHGDIHEKAAASHPAQPPSYSWPCPQPECRRGP